LIFHSSDILMGYEMSGSSKPSSYYGALALIRKYVWFNTFWQQEEMPTYSTWFADKGGKPHDDGKQLSPRLFEGQPERGVEGSEQAKIPESAFRIFGTLQRKQPPAERSCCFK